MVRFEKGSQEMKDFMARIRAMRKGKNSDQGENTEPTEPTVKAKRRGRLAKGSQEAKDFMAMLRAKKKK